MNVKGSGMCRRGPNPVITRGFSEERTFKLRQEKEEEGGLVESKVGPGSQGTGMTCAKAL